MRKLLTVAVIVGLMVGLPAVAGALLVSGLPWAYVGGGLIALEAALFGYLVVTE